MAASPNGAQQHLNRFQRLIRRFRPHRKGATAVEFAMIAPMFLGSLFAIMETGVLFIQRNAIDAGVEEAKRVTMTGQVAGAGGSTLQFEKFKAAFCAQVDWTIDCAKVKFDVRAFTTFASASMPNPIVSKVFNTSSLTFKPGKPCEIVVVRAYYETTSLTAMIRNDVSNLSNGNVVLSGSAAFKNEPYGAC